MASLLAPPPNLRSIVTRRSLLPPPGAPEARGWQESWTYLFDAYQPAMERYVVAVLKRAGARGSDREAARDIVQSYLTECLAKGWLSRDEVEIQCFRAYLQTQMRRYVYAWLRHRGAKKRDAGSPGDAAGLEAVPATGADPAERELDAGWVEVALGRALEALRLHNETYYEVVADLLRTAGEGSADLAARLGRSPKQLVMLRHRARKRLVALFYDALRETVRDDDAFDDLCQRVAPLLP